MCVILMRSTAGASDSLGNLVKDIGIVNEIYCENALEQVRMNLEFMSNSCKYNNNSSSAETYLP